VTDQSAEIRKWQPARLINAHKGYTKPSPLTKEEREHFKRKVVRVCEWDPAIDLLFSYRAAGCDADKFFRIHPEDMPERLAGRIIVHCEHGVLTD
jgi:hypothetical protein